MQLYTVWITKCVSPQSGFLKYAVLKIRNKRIDTRETDLVKAEFLRRGLNAEAVAALVGVDVKTVQYGGRTNFASDDFRRRVEAFVFDYEVPIWSGIVALAARKDALARLGVDPCLIRDREELMRIVRLICGPVSMSRTSRKGILRLLFAALAGGA